MVFTDPPYGQSYQSNFKKNKFEKIENDDIVLDIFPGEANRADRSKDFRLNDKWQSLTKRR